VQLIDKSVKHVNYKAAPPKLLTLVFLEYRGIPIWVQVRISVYCLFVLVVWKKAKIFIVKAFSISDKQGFKSKFQVSVLGSHPLEINTSARNTVVVVVDGALFNAR
jgi:hypothetical protein